MLPRSQPILLAVLATLACVQFQEHGGLSLQDGAVPMTDASPDTRPGPSPDAAPRDVAAPPDGAADLPAPPADAGECTPQAVSCTPDGKAPRTCDATGHWVAGTACAGTTACSAGVCLCALDCVSDPGLSAQASGFVEDLVGGGPALHLAVNGPTASVHRFEIATGKASTVKTGDPDFTLFRLDGDPTGTLITCSATFKGGGQSGQLTWGTQRLDGGPCTWARRRDDAVYFKSDNLYRKSMGSAARQMVTTEPMDTFEIEGNYLYFAFKDTKDVGSLKRLSLTDPTKVEMLLQEASTRYVELMPDAKHIYVIADGEILRVSAGGGAPETFWKATGLHAAAMVQTDTHVYWSAAPQLGGMVCTGETQILRQAKAGGQPTVLSRNSNYCAGDLVRLGNQIYTAIWNDPLGATSIKILRIQL
jgi:hypothetical protein